MLIKVRDYLSTLTFFFIDLQHWTSPKWIYKMLCQDDEEKEEEDNNNHLPLCLSCLAAAEAAAGGSVVVVSCKTL